MAWRIAFSTTGCRMSDGTRAFMAAAKVTAWWGTDYLLLGKFDGRWMIRDVLWKSLPSPNK